MARINSRAKGIRGENSFIKTLLELLGREKTHKDRRNGQAVAHGGCDNPDVSLLGFERVHYEVKHTKSFQFPAWVKQVREDCPAHKVPVIAYKEPNKQDYFWLTFPLEKLEKFALEVVGAFGWEVSR